MKMLETKTQKGIALILALLVVSLVTAITVELSWRFDLSFNRAANRFAGAQAYSFLKGAEQWAYFYLTEDLKEDQKRDGGTPCDSLNEIWATEVAGYQPENIDATISLKLIDAQGRFNLNSLYSKFSPRRGGSIPEWQKWTAQQRRFIRLLQTLELEEGVPVDLEMATAITAAIIDWLDQAGDDGFEGVDQPRHYLGAEEDYYSRLEPPVTIPNQTMISVSELRVIRGITPELYQQLLPLVVALPNSDPNPQSGERKAADLNINTMPPELMPMFNAKDDLRPLMPDEIQMLMESRGGMPMSNTGGTVETQSNDCSGVEEFKQTLQMYIDPNMLDTNGLTANSSFFLMTAEVVVGDYVRQGNALLYRSSDGIVTTLRRTDANF